MLTIDITGLDAATKRVRNMPKQIRYGLSRALNETAFKARLDVQAEMRSVFVGATPWIQKTVFVKPSTRANLETLLYLETLGGKSVDPNSVLQGEVFGGGRNAKRFEVALRRIGILGPREFAVPGGAAPLDANGNLPGPFIVRLLAYFEAFGEQGYRANMTDKGRAKLAKVKRVGGFKSVTGVQYFVSHGKGTRGTRHVNAAGKLSRPDGQAQHLAAGIWSRTGIHGVDVKPIVMFVKAPSYRVRLRMRTVVDATVQRELPASAAKWIGVAVATAN